MCVCAGAGVCVSALCRDPGRLAPPTHLWHLPLGPPLFRIPSRRFSTTTTTPLSIFVLSLFLVFCFNRNCGFLRIARTGKRESLSLSGRSTTLPRCFFVLFSFLVLVGLLLLLLVRPIPADCVLVTLLRMCPIERHLGSRRLFAACRTTTTKKKKCCALLLRCCCDLPAHRKANKPRSAGRLLQLLVGNKEEEAVWQVGPDSRIDRCRVTDRNRFDDPKNLRPSKSTSVRQDDKDDGHHGSDDVGQSPAFEPKPPPCYPTAPTTFAYRRLLHGQLSDVIFLASSPLFRQSPRP